MTGKEEQRDGAVMRCRGDRRGVRHGGGAHTWALHQKAIRLTSSQLQLPSFCDSPILGDHGHQGN